MAMVKRDNSTECLPRKSLQRRPIGRVRQTVYVQHRRATDGTYQTQAEQRPG